MLKSLVLSRLMIGPDPARVILVFFAYSLLGYVLECLVLSIENKQLVTNRGFAVHLPFCIIYGFGALFGFAFLHPFRHNMILLFAVGAICATVFEYIVAWIQIRLFGHFWWDYNEKPFNYKGILCLESTVGWGVVAVVIIMALHSVVVGLINHIPTALLTPLAALLVLAYFVDFVYSARQAKQNQTETELEIQEVYTDYTNQ